MCELRMHLSFFFRSWVKRKSLHFYLPTRSDNGQPKRSFSAWNQINKWSTSHCFRRDRFFLSRCFASLRSLSRDRNWPLFCGMWQRFLVWNDTFLTIFTDKLSCWAAKNALTGRHNIGWTWFRACSEQFIAFCLFGTSNRTDWVPFTLN